ncbi:T6SS immunity protein Tdi1 domain-containing protein [Promicromonospora sp. NPDC060204]|uniref:T6SS immunity protein Tdi1 domain-containing protein n=1 Tax=Promicromonospora sp. NPDC060204 TaxID=3347071 RepID=UPI0036682E81
MKLLRTFPKVAFEFGLASWHWMGIREQTPRFATCFGDIFLESLDGWWFLDTVEGTLELRWNSAVTMYAELESADGRATYLMDDLVRDARSRGIRLSEEDVYTFNPHPALGGELGVDGLGTMRFELALNWVGQMHDRVRHSSGEIRLPPMPDDGRRAAPAPAAQPWDSSWSHDETFDVPFEQYLATTTFAAVSAPRRNDDGYPSLPPSSGREDAFGQTPQAAEAFGDRSFGDQGFGGRAYDSPDRAEPTYGGRHGSPRDDGAQPYQTPSALDRPWSQEYQAAPLWTGQTESAQPWAEPHQPAQPATPPGGYDAPYDQGYPAAAGYGTSTSGEQPGAPYDQQQHWAAYDTAQGAGQADAQGGGPGGGPEQPGQAAPVWDTPAWGGQAPAGGQQQNRHTDEAFTAWDDLWGRR